MTVNGSKSVKEHYGKMLRKIHAAISDDYKTSIEPVQGSKKVVYKAMLGKDAANNLEVIDEEGPISKGKNLGVKMRKKKSEKLAKKAEGKSK
jgi:hypothetical protein